MKKNPNPFPIFTRSEPKKIYSRLSAPNKPTTLDEAARSIEFIAATEQPVTMYDWDRGEVDEILLTDGVVIPDNGQVPFLDSHDRSTVDAVLGSMRNFRKAVDLFGTAFFAKDQKSYDSYRKVADGHVTDVSVGYNVLEAIYCDPGQEINYKGRKFTAGPDRPLKLSTKWELREVSLTPIGADDKAKVRAEEPAKAPEKQPEKPAQPALKIEGGSFKMNRKLYNILIQRGLAAGSTDAEALAFLNALTPEVQTQLRAEAEKPEPKAPEAPAVNEAELRAKIEREITERTSTIRESCRAAGLDDIADELSRTCKTVDEARAEIIKRLAKTKPAVPVNIQLSADEGDKFRSAVIDGFLVREGVAVEKPAAGHEEFRFMTPSRLAEECLRVQGKSTRSMSKSQVVKLAMKRGGETIAHGTAHFPYILENIANKMALKGFEEAPRQWPLLAAVRSVSDFKEFSISGISGAEDLDVIEELAPYTEGEFKERREKAKIAKYGKKFSISFEGMVNDDMGEFTKVPRRHGQAASRCIEKLVFAILTGNPVMGDTKTLFHADHNNSLAADALDSAALGAMRAAMRAQKGHGADSEALDIPMSRIITGTDLEYTANLLTNSVGLPDSGMSAAVANPNRGLIAISSGLITSKTAYYGSADPNMYDTIVAAFLDGKQTPDLEEIYQTDVDGYVFKVRICAVAKAADWLGLIYNPGA